ncbi:hypothetical protein CEUSTIGMA_g9568.t1 [Chlamydomonas eustigma]|uniref:Uncharacterized protein n=1 Tax=Chlamydomonas eustigma TaxID=1157962 RepID=A0A250XH72_9CHLO|nr:hypothetical protein CEUSTIGMA_g9568.t1 [Chlamydomonas eustigma]|eukprot:GAX82140.1 hypothetical protein CEUSTIGMA_g9568.t1 [Chlamydomonas eustigma]
MSTGISLVTLLLPASQSIAKDFKEAQAEKEARRKALKEATGEVKSTGVDVQQVFAVPEYSVSEEARTPNVHSRQESLVLKLFSYSSPPYEITVQHIHDSFKQYIHVIFLNSHM